jgi:hypothetical protein
VTRAVVIVVTLLLLGLYGLAAWLAAPRFREIDWLARLPRADAASATSRPARYAGRLYGPGGRLTPLGDAAAAYWWSVTSGDGEGGKKARCKDRQRSRLTLVTATGEMPIAWAEADPDEVGLASDEQDGDYDLPLAFDVGGSPAATQDTPPPGTCAGDEYEQVLIPRGAAVEVVGCAKDGAIDRCSALVGGVLSVPDLGSDRRHRVRDAVHWFLIPLLGGAHLLVLSAFVVVAAARKSRRVVRPGKDVGQGASKGAGKGG